MRSSANCSATAPSPQPAWTRHLRRPCGAAILAASVSHAAFRPATTATTAPASLPDKAKIASRTHGRPPTDTPHGYYDLNVSFLTGSAEVSPRSRDEVNAFAAALGDSRLAGRRIRIEGQTDSRGSTQKNQDLSERRTQAIAAMIETARVDAVRLDVRGYGSTQPLPGTAASDGVNRRVVAVLSD